VKRYGSVIKELPQKDLERLGSKLSPSRKKLKKKRREDKEEKRAERRAQSLRVHRHLNYEWARFRDGEASESVTRDLTKKEKVQKGPGGGENDTPGRKKRSEKHTFDVLKWT